MAAGDIEIVAKLQQIFPTGDLVARLNDDEALGEFESQLSHFVDPDFETVMIGPDYLPTARQGKGIQGFREAWLDWTSPFETFTIEVDEIDDSGSGVLTIGRQRGRTKTGGIEIETPAAAVWWVRDGKVERVEFHLDLDVARRSAGIGEAPGDG